jgi:Ni2+-binding GTPase involved in maturation of urease and hydrogenase
MKLVLTGGFLGSGKTTAIVGAVRLLLSENKKVTVITNDQGEQQVDSAFVKSFGIAALEVSNGCFCCNYQRLDNHLQSLSESDQPDIIFAESVGSCTDLIATVVKPLAKFKPHVDVVISIFADAGLLNRIIKGKDAFQDDSVRYIYRKQIEEADVLILNKSDLISRTDLDRIYETVKCEYATKVVLHQNSLDTNDVAAWLECIQKFSSEGRGASMVVDYERYGDGESRLAWLDKSFEIDAPKYNAVFAAGWIIRHIVNRIQSHHLPIGHLKFFIEGPSGSEKISVTNTSLGADVRLTLLEVQSIKVLINARVETQPGLLQKIVDETIADATQRFGCTMRLGKWSAFKPGFPKPVYRID